MNEDLSTYLNDHLAGSVAGLNLLEHVIESTSDTATGDVLASIKKEIEEDRDELQKVIERLGISESGFRKVSGWLGEKFAELKLRFDDPAGSSLLLFESLEAMSLGIEGKRSLWRALAVMAEQDGALRVADHERFVKRSEQQRETVERLRLETARAIARKANEEGTSRP